MPFVEKLNSVISFRIFGSGNGRGRGYVSRKMTRGGLTNVFAHFSRLLTILILERIWSKLYVWPFCDNIWRILLYTHFYRFCCEKVIVCTSPYGLHRKCRPLGVEIGAKSNSNMGFYDKCMEKSADLGTFYEIDEARFFIKLSIIIGAQTWSLP